MPGKEATKIVVSRIKGKQGMKSPCLKVDGIIAIRWASQGGRIFSADRLSVTLLDKNGKSGRVVGRVRFMQPRDDAGCFRLHAAPETANIATSSRCGGDIAMLIRVWMDRLGMGIGEAVAKIRQTLMSSWSENSIAVFMQCKLQVRDICMNSLIA
ncbi:hypothetical protein PE067_14005 [Paracoccus sp. DMF-8]|uniref:hypothetical protein n=1 Tax=Paracoccus sp. DMF-8 TaxID=3019445 RepID=UPI0023E757B0|nr:hypothetical protein [Paracoccus sp. DMF-8]MDF3607149.1 hypothetical protein [Paracoccus sp. DMF-8]